VGASMSRLRVVMHIVVLTWLICACEAKPDVSQSPAAPTVQALAPTATPARPTAPPASIPVLPGWARADVPVFYDPIRSTSIRAVAEHDGRVVGVGGAGEEPAVWVSDAVGSWERASVPDSPVNEFWDVAASETGWVAVGPRYDEEPGGVVGAASPDGRAWTSVSIPADGWTGTLAVGTNGQDWLTVMGSDDGTDGTAAISRDGLTWELLGPVPVADVYSITSLDGDWLVSGAQVGEGFPAGLFRSPDGVSWQRVETPRGAGTIVEILGLADRFVAAGSSSVDEALSAAAIWTSPNLETWTPADVPNASSPNRDAAIHALAGGEGRLVAVGEDADGQAGIWVSGDGLVWRHETDPALDTDPGRSTVSAVTLREGAIEVFGTTPMDDPSFRSIVGLWTSPPAASTLPTRWIPPSPGCPNGRVGLVDVAALTRTERLDCFGDRALNLRGYVSGVDCGDMDGGDPAWLAGGCPILLIPEPGSPFAFVHVDVFADPESEAAQALEDALGRRVTVTGAFDSPIAQRCKPPEGETADSTVKRCRERFVVSRVVR
jgi:hypothetical protein